MQKVCQPCPVAEHFKGYWDCWEMHARGSLSAVSLDGRDFSVESVFLDWLAIGIDQSMDPTLGV